MGTRTGRLTKLAVIACALLCAVPAAATAADPGRWSEVGRQTVPLDYFQGITSDPTGDLFFDGINTGLYRTSTQLTEEFRDTNVIPPAVSASTPTGEGYNHIGDLTYNSADGGRILVPLECFTSGVGNFCKTGAIGVASLTGVWQYYVKLQAANTIEKAMWIESSDDGTKLYTQGGPGMGSGGANQDLLVYNASDINAGNADTPGTASDPHLITPANKLTNVLPPPVGGDGGQMTGATFFGNRLYVARSFKTSGPTDTFQVWSLNPNAGNSAAVAATLRLEIEKQVAGESEGLDVNGSFGGVLNFQITPIPSALGVQKPSYNTGVTSLLQFVPQAADIADSDGDGIANSDDACPNQPGNLLDGCSAGTPDPGDEDKDRINVNVSPGNPTADNCPAVANNLQNNADQDSQGDACDADDDNDAVNDTGDNCQFVKNADQLNTDGDAKGNACEDDDDNDTVVDYYDNCPVNANADQADSNGDGVGDACSPAPADTTPPDTVLGKVKVKKSKATITFASTETAGGTYECTLDGKPIKGKCDSPLKLKGLKPGKHKVEIAAVDLAGNVDPTPVKAKLKVAKPKKHKKG